MLKEEYKDCNIHDFDNEILEAMRQPLKIIEPSYEFLMGFYDGIFYKETKITTNLTYEYLKGFYKGTIMRFK